MCLKAPQQAVAKSPFSQHYQTRSMPIIRRLTILPPPATVCDTPSFGHLAVHILVLHIPLLLGMRLKHHDLRKELSVYPHGVSDFVDLGMILLGVYDAAICANCELAEPP